MVKWTSSEYFYLHFNVNYTGPQNFVNMFSHLLVFKTSGNCMDYTNKKCPALILSFIKVKGEHRYIVHTWKN